MLKKNQIMITALAIMIAVAGYLNFAGTKVTEEDIMTVDSDTIISDESNLAAGSNITSETTGTDVTALLDISDEDIEQASVYGDIESLDTDMAATTADYLDEGMADNKMFASQLLQLAVKGHIKIQKENPDSKKSAFVITYTDKSANKKELTKLEQGFLRELLGIKNSLVIDKKYNENVSKAHKYLITEIGKKQAGLYFNKNLKLIPLQYIVPLISIIGMAYLFQKYDGDRKSVV